MNCFQKSQLFFTKIVDKAWHVIGGNFFQFNVLFLKVFHVFSLMRQE